MINLASNARQVALDVLNDIFGNDAYANIALDRTLREVQLSDLDRNFVTALVYGVVSKEKLLEWYLEPFFKTTETLGQDAFDNDYISNPFYG